MESVVAFSLSVDQQWAEIGGVGEIVPLSDSYNRKISDPSCFSDIWFKAIVKGRREKI